MNGTRVIEWSLLPDRKWPFNYALFSSSEGLFLAVPTVLARLFPQIGGLEVLCIPDDIASALSWGHDFAVRRRFLMDQIQGRDFFYTRSCNALEVLTNLSHMLRVEVNHPRQALIYLSLMDAQLLSLTGLVKAEIATRKAPDNVLRHKIELRFK
jgi:hypothetical protein